MDPPYWCTTVVHQYGGRKILYTSGTYSGQTKIYINSFPATLTSQMAKNRKVNVYFLKCDF